MRASVCVCVCACTRNNYYIPKRRDEYDRNDGKIKRGNVFNGKKYSAERPEIRERHLRTVENSILIQFRNFSEKSVYTRTLLIILVFISLPYSAHLSWDAELRFFFCFDFPVNPRAIFSPFCPINGRAIRRPSA